MEQVLIVGAGGFGREVLAWCRADPDHGRTWQVAGFLDDGVPKVAPPLPVMGRIVDHQPAADQSLLLALGSPVMKAKVVPMLRERGARFRTFVHPTAILGSDVEIGAGTVVCPRVVLTVNVTIGAFVTLNVSSSVGHDARIGDYSTLSGHCDVTGFVTLGAGVLLGSHSAVTPGRKVGDGAVIGAGAVVFTNVPAGVTVVGNPARPLRGV
jgi:sugar O-acyltransferase (sialic acid O-acetyltransferase NeuD family)